MPDWSVENDYAYTRELSPAGWAWEFLRRNPEYRSDYQECVPLDRLWQQAGHNVNEHCIFVPRKIGDETLAEWQRRVIMEEESTPHAYRPALYYALRWPIAGIIKDPADNSPPGFKSPGEHPRLLRYDEALSLFEQPDGDEAPHIQAGTTAAIALDLEGSFDRQLPRLREVFQEQRRTRNVQGIAFELERWTMYLRILDAKEHHVTSHDICRSFHQKYYDEGDPALANKEVNRLFKTAKLLYSPTGTYTILKRDTGRT